MYSNVQCFGRYPGLVKSLRGLLMLLPQTEAYRILYLRLQSGLIGVSSIPSQGSEVDGKLDIAGSDSSALIEVFSRRHVASSPGTSRNVLNPFVQDSVNERSSQASSMSMQNSDEKSTLGFVDRSMSM